MGTRGFVGFVANGEEKIAYNHWDSYVDGLGVKVLAWAREAAKEPAALRAAVLKLRVVKNGERPTAEDKKRLRKWTDLGVSEKSTDDWYCLLRGTQGDPAAMLEAGVIEDASEFPLDSLFAEWGYLIDTDGDGMLEVYQGFQHAPHGAGRFARRDDYLTTQRKEREENPRMAGLNVYYPVALVASFPLADLPSEAEFLTALREKEDE
jgi:hypothetical protein